MDFIEKNMILIKLTLFVYWVMELLGLNHIMGSNLSNEEKNNFVKFYLCEFHFKQAIHHITTDDNERFYLLHIFKTKSKSYFLSNLIFLL